MFGYVMANHRELEKTGRRRYSAVYCGICRGIRGQCSQVCRLGLSYDMAFLALLLMSLYEPEETGGSHACLLHPARPWTDSKFIHYGADMNVALAYYKALDDDRDEGKLSAKCLKAVFGKELNRIRTTYPRQCGAIETCIDRLNKLEKDNCPNPDEPASCFGALMGELLVYEEDLWAPTLRKLGDALGRYIYLADAAVDYRRDQKKKQYNPFLAMGMEADWTAWEQYLVLAMSRCTDAYERLPLVQDKDILDNILYSGIWLEYRRKQRKSGGGTP